MKRIFALLALLLITLPAWAQNFPVNCATSFLTYTAATHAYTCGSAALTYSGAAVTMPGTLTVTTSITNSALTAGRVVYSGTAGIESDSANLTYDDTNKRLTVGSGSTTSSGMVMGNLSNTVGGVWNTNSATPTTDFALRQDANGITMLNGLSTNSTVGLYLRVSNADKMTFIGTAGAGPSITAGTATTDVAALSVTRTNNNAAVATGVKFAFTDTTSAAGFLPFQVLGSSTGTANLFQVDKSGNVIQGHAGSSNVTTRYDANSSSIGYFGRISSQFGLFDGSANPILLAGGTGTAGTWNSMLLIGGTTSSFPALKRNSAQLEVKLADDSAYTTLTANQLAANTNITITSRSVIASAVDGNFELTNNAGSSFGLLKFGGTTSSFPALKRSGAALEVRLADDSAYGNIRSAAWVGISGTLIRDVADGIVDIVDAATTSGAVLQLKERTAPSAPAADTARIYVQDNGAGKTQVCALFNSGAAQCFATQP